MCTNLRLKATNDAVIIGRTMDLNIDLKSKILFVPKGTSFTSRAPNGNTGVSWQAQYSFVGMNALGQQALTDGMNEHGLYVGALYLPGFTQYQEVPSDQLNKALTPSDTVAYILANAMSVGQAKEIMQNVFVWQEVTPEVNIAFPLHFSVHDKEGNAAVFEYLEGDLKIHDNTLGVLTNAPTYDWHLINLRNYINLTPNDILGKNLNNVMFTQLGEGSGMMGLPGDFTPPSRFVRAVALTRSALPSPDAASATIAMVHVINNFDLVLGVERNINGEKVDCDYSQWTTMSDLSNLLYYVRIHDNPGFVRVSLRDFDASKPGIVTLDPNQAEWYKAL
jgi:choloylglycine hydrolase